MHHQAVKSNLIDSSLTIDKLGYDQDQPLCPKPRRLSHAIPEILKPLKCPKHRFDGFIICLQKMIQLVQLLIWCIMQY
ncbi:hypothetical protein L6164_020204 [Bauhinia variegata]|uniref:Uncharacterized protein n=1 Tax=Bauhinia variegata TaxID=167791 RepID=A0ACB9MVY6_BAUVA|nr:hypothetical protein L6164_020204 [Bauhinia variegata]